MLIVIAVFFFFFFSSLQREVYLCCSWNFYACNLTRVYCKVTVKIVKDKVLLISRFVVNFLSASSLRNGGINSIYTNNNLLLPHELVVLLSSSREAYFALAGSSFLGDYDPLRLYNHHTKSIRGFSCSILALSHLFGLTSRSSNPKRYLVLPLIEFQRRAGKV